MEEHSHINKTKCDVLILGAGVVGLATGIALLESKPTLKVIIAEKEERIALHASGRNSGVLHAGFYYSPDSLKAKFCREGNFELRKLAKKYSIPIREVGKVVVTRHIGELDRLNSLHERGVVNGVELEILDESLLPTLEPLAVTKEKFLWSPTTAVSDPKSIIEAMYQEFTLLGGKVDFNKRISLKIRAGEVYDSTNSYDAACIVNAAGAQADRISRSINIGSEYAMLPFMGLYRATTEKKLPLQRLVYPVPHPINPFLGVHFTLTVDHKVKIGPTAIPIAGREQYSILKGWSVADIGQSLLGVTSLIRGDAHDFGALLKSEWPKLVPSLLLQGSTDLVPTAKTVRDWDRKPPGIRAQLVHLPTGNLVQDFIVQTCLNSTHILNAVSPGWTSALPFGRWVANKI
jgi:(S)-2-hydroxyglutarate dehydrogenase